MAIRLHVGSQTIYLRGWVNMDVIHPGAGLAADYPARVERWITDESDYYGRKKDKTPETIIKEGPESNDGDVCDVWGSWQQMPFDDQTVEEILSRQVFEHLSRPETMDALTEARRVLVPGGILRLDVPDHDATIEELEHQIRCHQANEEKKARRSQMAPSDSEMKKFADQIALMKRHLLGSRKNDWAVHMGSWTREALIEFCDRYGFEFIKEEPNIHFYPAFCLQFRKGNLPPHSPISDQQPMLRKAAWMYANFPGSMEEKYILEVGPGKFPWPEADIYVDDNGAVIHDLKQIGRDAVEANVEFLPDNWTGKFDYVLASHVLEHVDDPIKAAAELSRVAKAGTVICPHPMKEGLFTAHETDHKWFVLAGRDCLYFHQIPWKAEGDARPEHLYKYLHDPEIAGQQHRLWRYGDPRLEGMSRKMREWWYRVEPMLDTIFHWQGELKVQVLR